MSLTKDYRLFISGYPENIKADVLKQRFEAYGKVKRLDFITKKSFAFITIETNEIDKLLKAYKY